MDFEGHIFIQTLVTNWNYGRETTSRKWITLKKASRKNWNPKDGFLQMTVFLVLAYIQTNNVRWKQWVRNLRLHTIMAFIFHSAF